MKCSKSFLQSKSLTILFSLGFLVTLVGLTIGGVVVETEDGTSQEQEIPKPKDYAKDAREGSQESYDVIPLQDPSQFFPAYPGVAGPNMPMPPTHIDPNADQRYLPQPPTGQTPHGSPSGGDSMGGVSGDPTTGARPDMMPSAPMGGGGGGGGQMMPAAPTPGQNLNQLGIADPQYGRFESARIEAALMPHQPAYVNATRNQVARGGKPFSGYQQPSPYSPYMSLMRTQDSIRGINNYYEYVMPQIQQQQTNRQVSKEIVGLENAARSGYEALQQIKQRPGNAPVQSGGIAPATYMNTGGYFGAGQR